MRRLRKAGKVGIAVHVVCCELLHVSELIVQVHNEMILLKDLRVEGIDLLLLRGDYSVQLSLSLRNRLCVSVENPEPLLVKVQLCALSWGVDRSLNGASVFIVFPVVKMDKCDVVDIRIRRLFLDNIHPRDGTNPLELELLLDEIGDLHLVVLSRGFRRLGWKRASIATRDIEGHF